MNFVNQTLKDEKQSWKTQDIYLWIVGLKLPNYGYYPDRIYL